MKHIYDNKAYVAVDTGLEVQIDEEARGDARIGEQDGAFYNHTGAIYKVTTPGQGPGKQDFRNGQKLAAGIWHHYLVKVQGATIDVQVNGQTTTKFENADAFRGRSPGYVGLQAHTGKVAFANVKVS